MTFEILERLYSYIIYRSSDDGTGGAAGPLALLMNGITDLSLLVGD